MPLAHVLLSAALALAPAAAPATRDSTHPRVALPDTPAGRAAGEWLAAFNSGDRERVRRWITAAFAPEALARRPADMLATTYRWRFRNLGAQQLVRVEAANDTAVRLVVRQPQVEGWGRLDVRVDAAAPHRILAADLTRYEDVPEARAGRVPRTDREVAAEVDRLAERLTRRGLFAGTVVLVHRGRTVSERAYGLADRAAQRANTLDTRFDLASVGKMFTAVSILQLAEQGKLSLDDAVGRLLPDYPNADAARRVTVRHLLTHTSGLADYFRNPAFDLAHDTLVRPRDYWRYFAADSLAFEPGTRWEYANSNFILLGAIVEQVSGEPYLTYVRRHVFAPAGMTATWAPEAKEPVATPYSYYKPPRTLDPDHEAAVGVTRPAGSAAGGGLSTAREMARFARAIVDGRLLGAAFTDSILTGHGPGWTPTSKAGFGFDAEDGVPGLRVVSKGGYGPGSHTELEIYPDAEWAAVVLSNTDAWGTEAVYQRVRTLLARQGRARR